jgi:hypothetical protein
MQQSQDIGNVRRELILKALSAPSTQIDCPPQRVGSARLQRELVDENQARIQAQKKAIERLMLERFAQVAVT